MDKRKTVRKEPAMDRQSPVPSAGQVARSNLATFRRIAGFVSLRADETAIFVTLDNAANLSLLPREIEGVKVEGMVGPRIMVGHQRSANGDRPQSSEPRRSLSGPVDVVFDNPAQAT